MKNFLKNFCHMIKQQNEVPTKGFHIDNANHEVKAFFEDEGIRHETSCPYTPYKNGLAKRKIGDIIDIEK